MPTYLDELISPFCVKLGTPAPAHAFGQLFRVPAYYPYVRLQVWRPRTTNPTLGVAQDFNIAAPTDMFKRALPLTAPPLATNEEFIVLRGKKRPVILVEPPDPRLSTVPPVRGGGKLVRNLAPVALLYSAVDQAGIAKFDAAFLDRVRLLEYPQFLFVPTGGPITVDSIARFDELQSVDVRNLEPTGFGLTPDVIAILKSQMSFFLTGLAGQAFQDWASELRH